MVEVESKRQVLRTGSYFIIPKNTTHSYGATENNYWSIYWIHFTGIIAECLYKRYSQDSAHKAVGIPLEKKRIDLFQDIFSILESGYSISNVEFMNILLWELLSSFMYYQLSQNVGHNEYSDRVDKSIQYMRDNLDKSLRIEDIASYFGYSASHYFTLFKKRTGYSPLHYFNQMKIQAACQHLTFTRMSVKEIGFKLGYEDSHYFSRIFKKQMNLSPLQYRKSYS